MKILITGVAGMIGSHLLDSIIHNNDVSIVYGIDDLSVGKEENIAHHLGDRQFVFYRGNILDESFLNAIPPVNVIVHLAAAKKIGEKSPGVDNLRTNGIGSENILKLAHRFGAKIIVGSTSDCYGMSPNLPLREDGDLLIGPSMIKRWSYAVGKLFAEQLAFAYMKDFNVPVVVLRYFGGFSERASFTWSSGHIPIFIDNILKNEECIIHGNGLQTRSMAYVSNLLEPTVAAIFNCDAVGEIINVGDDREISVLDSAIIIHKIANTGRKLKLKFVDTAEIFGKYKDINRRCPDLTKAKRLLGYKTRISFEEGISKVIEERRKYLQRGNCKIAFGTPVL